MSVAAHLTDAWYAHRLTPLTLALAPLTALFVAASATRRTLYRMGILPTKRLPVPVMVVGNITAGGSGKTPLVAALAHELAARGWHPGIVSRGYGRRDEQSAAPLLVTSAADPVQAGDEPVLLARRGFPVVVARDRVAAAHALLAAHPRCRVIIADDGLQHYALGRDVEIAVVDAARGFGNGWRLPAGPLRETPRRLVAVDAVVALVANDAVPLPAELAGAFRMTLAAESFRRVNASEVVVGANAFAGTGVHAIAGIGNPHRFFALLRSLGIDAIAHPYPDHHRFVAADLALPDARAVLMTEKDAIKCTTFADERCWYLPVSARIDPALVARVEEKLRGYQAA
jgi:tetraacyldisaccharide 4'-kinase